VRPNKALQLTGGEGCSRGEARHSASQALPRSHRVERRPQLNAGVRRTLDASAAVDECLAGLSVRKADASSGASE
jgi:hypothetical protein